MMMNFRSALCFLLLLCTGAPLFASVDSLLQVFDREVQAGERHERQLQLRIGELRRLAATTGDTAARIGYNQRLVENYLYYNYDSALCYVRRNLHLATVTQDKELHFDTFLRYIYLDIYNGRFIHAENSLNFLRGSRLDSVQTERLRLASVRFYYHQLRDSAFAAPVYPDSAFRDRLSEALGYYQQYPERIPPGEWDIAYYIADRLGGSAQARAYLEPIFAKAPQGMRYYSFLAMQLRRFALADGDQARADSLLLLAAISDQRGCIRNGRATYLLARHMFARGDFERAYRYSYIVLDSADRSNCYMNKLHIAGLLNDIRRVYDEMTATAARRRSIALILILMLAAVLAIALVLLRYRMRQLRGVRTQLERRLRHEELLNKNLSRLHEELERVNKVKEGYIAVFLGMRPWYLERLRRYINLVSKHLKGGEVDRIAACTQQELTALRDFERSHTDFDRMFLDIVPGFVAGFNDLLVPEARIDVPDGILTIELRIFALIRLGIADTAQIAHYLGYSVNTIYNYRSRVRAGALADRERFEAQVMTIGAT